MYGSSYSQQREKAKVLAQEDVERQRQDRELQTQQEEEERQQRKKVIVDTDKSTAVFRLHFFSWNICLNIWKVPRVIEYWYSFPENWGDYEEN